MTGRQTTQGDGHAEVCRWFQQEPDGSTSCECGAFSPARKATVEQAWRCPHAPECEERFDTLDGLNEHVDRARHTCCQQSPPARETTDRGDPAP